MRFARKEEVTAVTDVSAAEGTKVASNQCGATSARSSPTLCQQSRPKTNNYSGSTASTRRTAATCSPSESGKGSTSTDSRPPTHSAGTPRVTGDGSSAPRSRTVASGGYLDPTHWNHKEPFPISTIELTTTPVINLTDQAATKLAGSTLDYKDSLIDAGFHIENPNTQRSCGCGKSFS